MGLTDSLFPNCAFININHLGISTKSRFNSKQRLISDLCSRNAVIGIQELHLSPARAHDSFFCHFGDHIPLYNVSDGHPGQCILVSKFLPAIPGGDDASKAQFLSEHHITLVPNVAHCFWWTHESNILVFVNMYLSAHDQSLRGSQLELITTALSEFCDLHANFTPIVVLGGDRNFVVRPHQHQSSANTSWHPGERVLNGWRILLQAMRVEVDTELDEPTFSKNTCDRNNETAWCSRTLDFAAAGFDSYRFLQWQVKVFISRSFRDRRASDHCPVELRFLRRSRKRSQRSPEGDGNFQPIPEWLFTDECFLSEWRSCLDSWEQSRQSGMRALSEFVELTQACARDWLKDHVVEARTVEHKFQVAIALHMLSCQGVYVPASRVFRLFAIYPTLRSLVDISIDTSCSSVRVNSSEALLGHVRQLSAQVVAAHAERHDRENENDVSAGATMQGGTIFPKAAADLKRMIPVQRYQLVEMWDGEEECMQTDPKRIGEIIRASGISRSGQTRGNADAGQIFLDRWQADFSTCRAELSISEVLTILLDIKAHKKPGTTGVVGVAYKLAAVMLAPIFIEAFRELQDIDFPVESIPKHIHETLWIPIAKKQGASDVSQVRDLELPNEDAKVLERMHSLVLSEVASDCVRDHNQAFIREGDIAHNIVLMHEAFQSMSSKRQLYFMIFLDCTKGYNLLSHSWVRRVFTAARLPAGLIRSIVRLTQTLYAYLAFAGILFPVANFLCGLKQGGPLSCIIFVICCAAFLKEASLLDGVSHVLGFCDDWNVALKGIRAVRQLRMHVQNFENASGLKVHRTKSTFLSNRQMSSSERHSLRSAWPDVQIVEKCKSLGTPIGHGVAICDLFAGILARFHERLRYFEKSHLSFAMRILALNTFTYPLFSYVTRFFLLPLEVHRDLSNTMLKFVAPLTFCDSRILCHCSTLFGIRSQLRDSFLDNVAAVLATAFRLQGRGSIDMGMLTRWAAEMSVHNDDMVPMSVLLETTRPLTHMAAAYQAFRRLTGITPDSVFQTAQRANRTRSRTPAGLHRLFYKYLLAGDRAQAEMKLKQRFSAYGLQADVMMDNLRRIPSSTPQAHRVVLMKFLLNGLNTTRRARFVREGPVSNCPFCSEHQGDSIEHWMTCPVLHHCFGVALSYVSLMDYGRALFNLQFPLGGRELQMVCSILHAVWRSRCVCLQGYTFFGIPDMIRHFRSLIENPWVQGCPETLDRSQRRAARSTPPAMPQDCLIYNVDGAARGGVEERKASCGAVLTINNLATARIGVYLGDETNNHAEYSGIICVLEHVLQLRYPRIYVRSDSLLVVNQIRGIWSCRSDALRPLCDRALQLMNNIRRDERITLFELSHVYREFNADADAIANETLDLHDPRIHTDNIVINDNWSPCVISPAVHTPLMIGEAGGDDESGSASSHTSTGDETTEDTEQIMNYHLGRWE